MAFRSISSLFSSDLAIDLGTANTCVYVRGKGIVVNEPSIIAINKVNGRVEAVGKDAKEMLGRTPGNIVAIKPMKDGVIADFEDTEKMLAYFIRKAHNNRNVWVRPRIVIGVPSEITQVEKRAVKDSAYRAKASEVHLVEEAMAAAIGAGMPITEPSGNMIVDIGGGTTDIAVISLAGIVYSKAVRVAGNEMDEAIIQYVKKTYNLLIGERTAEAIKMEVGSAYPLEERMTMEIKGRHLIEGVPKTITISDEEIREAARRDRQRHRRCRPRRARAHAAGTVGRHRGPRHRVDRWRRVAEEPRQALARRDRPAAGDGRRPAVVGRARRGQDAVGFQPAAEDLDRLTDGASRASAPGQHLSVRGRRRRPHRAHLGSGDLQIRYPCAPGRHLRLWPRRCSAPAPSSPAASPHSGTVTSTCGTSAPTTRGCSTIWTSRAWRSSRSARWRRAPRSCQRLLDLKKRTALETTAAEILAGSASPEFRSITIDKGLSDGLRPDMAVIAPTGVVGRVVTPTAGAAKVQLLVDRNAAAGALIERSRSQGVVLGSGGSTLRLDFVSDSADVRVGDTVVTSGIDGIYPSGFVIGRVSEVDRSSGAYHAIAIQPAVDFSSLEDVLVVLSPLLPVTASTPAPAPVKPDPGPPPAARPSAAPSVTTPVVSPARPAPAEAAEAGADCAAGDSTAGDSAEESRTMKVLLTLIGVLLAVYLQAKLGHLLVLGTAPLDLGLIGVVYAAIMGGPTMGLLAGTCAGLAQDALGGGIIMSKGVTYGIAGLANTWSGSWSGRRARSSS